MFNSNKINKSDLHRMGLAEHEREFMFKDGFPKVEPKFISETTLLKNLF